MVYLTALVSGCPNSGEGLAILHDALCYIKDLNSLALRDEVWREGSCNKGK
jgi:hypothetical protein